MSSPSQECRSITVLLDGVQNHYEIGSVFRVCETFRAQRLVICGARFNRDSRKLATASKGARQRLPWTAADDAFRVVKAAKDYGLSVIVCQQKAGTISVRAITPDRPALLVFGRSSQSISQPILDWADSVVWVPAPGSLGASATVAITLYAIEKA
jgi:23S rRNA (guanosine2251-2'-O)-methyltransferase